MWLYQPTLRGSVDVYWPAAEPSVVTGWTVSKAKTWERKSKVFNRSSFATNSSVGFRLDFNNPGTAYMYYNGIILIDLTAAFGAGNEPDVYWCDDNIKYTTGDITQTLTYYKGVKK